MESEKVMGDDELIEEVRAIRESYAERFGFDVRAIFLDAMERQKKSGRQLVTLEPRKISTSGGPTKRP